MYEQNKCTNEINVQTEYMYKQNTSTNIQLQTK